MGVKEIDQIVQKTFSLKDGNRNKTEHAKEWSSYLNFHWSLISTHLIFHRTYDWYKKAVYVYTYV